MKAYQEPQLPHLQLSKCRSRQVSERLFLHMLASSCGTEQARCKHQVMAEVRKQFQAIAAGKLVEGDRVLISGSLPSRLISVTRALEEAECYRLELDPDLPVESFHRPAGILTKGQQPHRRGRRARQPVGLTLEHLPEEEEEPLD